MGNTSVSHNNRVSFLSVMYSAIHSKMFKFALPDKVTYLNCYIFAILELNEILDNLPSHKLYKIMPNLEAIFLYTKIRY